MEDRSARCLADGAGPRQQCTRTANLTERILCFVKIRYLWVKRNPSSMPISRNGISTNLKRYLGKRAVDFLASLVSE